MTIDTHIAIIRVDITFLKTPWTLGDSNLLPPPFLVTSHMDRMLTVAAVVIFIATTPTWIDVWQIWHHPEHFDGDVDARKLRLAIVVWYLLLVTVALSAWRVLA